MDNGRDMKRELFEIGIKLYSDFHYDKGKWKASVWYHDRSSEHPCTWISCVFSPCLFVSLSPASLIFNFSLPFHIMLDTVRGAAVTPTVRRSCPPRVATEGFGLPDQEVRKGSRSCLRWASILSWILPRWSSHIAQVHMDGSTASEILYLVSAVMQSEWICDILKLLHVNNKISRLVLFKFEQTTNSLVQHNITVYRNNL